MCWRIAAGKVTQLVFNVCDLISRSQYVKCVIWNHIVVWLLESNSNMWRIADGEVTIQNNASLLSIIISNGNVTFLETPQLIN